MGIISHLAESNLAELDKLLRHLLKVKRRAELQVIVDPQKGQITWFSSFKDIKSNEVFPDVNL